MIRKPYKSWHRPEGKEMDLFEDEINHDRLRLVYELTVVYRIICNIEWGHIATVLKRYNPLNY